MEVKINGKERFLFIDPTGGINYKLVVCLTSNSYKRASSTIDASSYCGPDIQPGTQTITIDFAGQIVYTPDAGHISESDLNDLWQNSTLIGWKLGRGIPQEGDVVYEGKGTILSLNDAGAINSGLTFDASIGVSGTPTKTIANVTGPIATRGAIIPGSAYTNGSYTAVPVTGGSGTGATANVTVAGAVVTAFTIVNPGDNYKVGDSISATAASIGGTGTGFSTTVATIA